MYVFSQGETFSDPIVISTLPYTTSDNTALYGDDYDNEDSPCDENYLSGDDVVYAYTPTATGNFVLTLSNLSGTWAGIHVLDGSLDSGTPNCVGFLGNSSSSSDMELSLSLTQGVTYYILISTWASPQSITYDLSFVMLDCIQAEATASLGNTDCGTAMEYYVDVNITSLGDASNITDGTNFWPVTATGVTSVGPFTIGTSVNLELIHSNEECDLDLGTFEYYCSPANDDCEGAVELIVNPDLSCGMVTAGTTLGATASSQDDDVSGTPNTDVWFFFEATGTSHLISLSNVTNLGGGTSTSLDMGMGVYDGSAGCEALTLAGTSDPNTFTVDNLTIGGLYYVRVYGWATTIQYNSFDICIGSLPAAVTNDECDDAIALTVNADYDCGVVTSASTYMATASAQADDVTGTPNTDVWFSFVATGDTHKIELSNVTAIGSGTSTDMGMGVYDATGGCSALTLVGDSDPNSLTLTGLTTGTTYLVRVYGWGEGVQYNAFDICVGTLPEVQAPANDECSGAIVLTVNNDFNCETVTAGTTAGATPSAQDATGVVGTPNTDVWFSFEATSTSHLISLDNVEDLGTGTSTSTDMAMAVYNGTSSCEALSFMATSDPNAMFIGGLTAGEMYYVRVYGYQSSVQHVSFDICVGTSSVAPPANDDCDGAISLTVNEDYECAVTTTGSTEGATPSVQTDDITGTPNTDVWYSFVATDASHKISLSNVTNLGGGTSTSLDMGMAVYDATGGCSALTLVDDSDPNEFIIFGLTVGNTYLVRVYGWGTTVQYNSFDICIGTSPIEPPANDECDGAIALTVNSDASCGTVTSGTTEGATQSPQADDVAGTPNTDVWYSFVATNDSQIVSLSNVTNLGGGTSTSTDMAMAVYDAVGGCDALLLVDDSDPNSFTVTGLTVGSLYYVRVYGYSTSIQYNSFDICVGTPLPPPANDSCATATALTTLPFTAAEDATFCTNNNGVISACASGMNDGLWYTFTAGNAGTVDVEITNVSSWDPELAVYTGTCGNFTCAGSADSGYSGDGESVSITVEQGVTYYVNVAHYNGSEDQPEGLFTITVDSDDVALLGTESFEDLASFSYYPNPVNHNVLNIVAKNTINNIAVYNLIGQQVQYIQPDQTEYTIDMASLSRGTYFVKVIIGDTAKTIKIIKE